MLLLNFLIEKKIEETALRTSIAKLYSLTPSKIYFSNDLSDIIKYQNDVFVLMSEKTIGKFFAIINVYGKVNEMISFIELHKSLAIYLKSDIWIADDSTIDPNRFWHITFNGDAFSVSLTDEDLGD